MKKILDQLLTFFTFFTENHFFKFHSETVNLSEVKLNGTHFISFLHFKLDPGHTGVRHNNKEIVTFLSV